MKIRMSALVALALCSSSPLLAQVTKPGAELQKLASDFKFVEGPAADDEGSVYFSDVPNQRIHLWSLQNGLAVYRENSGGANGLFFNQAGHLIACEGLARRLTIDDMKGNIDILTDNYQGKKLNSPNDVWVDPKGGAYFTDPRYGRKNRDNMELEGEYVFYLSPDRKNLTIVCSDLTRPNGLIGTRDGKFLYVADHGDSKIWVYNVHPDGTLTGKKLFAERGSDGMTLDDQGNVYLTSGSVWVYDSSGKQIQEIELPESPTNLTFYGRDLRKLFITAHTSIYSIEMSVSGSASKTLAQD